jgi:hypothetical protein
VEQLCENQSPNEAAGQASLVPLNSAGFGMVNSVRPHPAQTISMPMALKPRVNIKLRRKSPAVKGWLSSSAPNLFSF